ncbi:UNVERIFIED_ORG: hypothetical protein J2W19_004932 [Shinella zoogloeoides]|nr:hypothetical protein [Shinella zoogloeoides]
MTIQENNSSTQNKGIFLPAGLVLLSLASVAIPIINIRVMGVGGGLTLASPLFLGGIAFLLPLTFMAGLAVRFAPQLQPYIRTLEICGLVITVGMVLYAIVTLLNGFNEINNAKQQMSMLMGSANARQFSSMGGGSLAGGCFALTMLLAGSAWQVWSSRCR